MIYKLKTYNAKIVEDIVKVAQKRYHIASIGGWQHYHNSVEHSVDIIDIASTVVCTLVSSFEYMKRGDLFDKVCANLEAIREGTIKLITIEEADDSEDESDDLDAEEAAPHNPVAEWLDIVIAFTGSKKDKVHFDTALLAALNLRYNNSTESAMPVSEFSGELATFFKAQGVWKEYPTRPDVAVEVKISPISVMSQDNLAQFLAGHCKFGPNLAIGTIQFLSTYNDWAFATQSPKSDKNKMPLAMKVKGFINELSRACGGQMKCYLGVDLDPEKPFLLAKSDEMCDNV